MASEIENLVYFSKYTAGRFDWTQASGGNSSVKQDHLMYIKASGCLMGDMSLDHGYSIVDLEKLQQVFYAVRNTPDQNLRTQEPEVNKRIAETVLKGEKPSMEVFMHALLGKYILHTHPVSVDAMACQKNWSGKIKRLFPEVLLVGYSTPGVELGMAVYRVLEKHAVDIYSPVVLFLQNHGLVVSADRFEEVIQKTEDITQACERAMGLNFRGYRLTSEIYRCINAFGEAPKICRLCCDQTINQLIMADKQLLMKTVSQPVSPTSVIYNGIVVVEIHDLTNPKPLVDYLNQNGCMPKIMLYQNKLFFIASTIKETMDCENVLKAGLLIREKVGQQLQPLSTEEINYLKNVQ